MEEIKRAPRRQHSAELRARVLAECAQPGASVAKVALAHGLNANLVHKWRRAAATASVLATTVCQPKRHAHEFVGVSLVQPSSAAQPGDIRIEVRRAATLVNISWPVQAAGDCVGWLREWLR